MNIDQLHSSIIYWHSETEQPIDGSTILIKLKEKFIFKIQKYDYLICKVIKANPVIILQTISIDNKEVLFRLY